MEEFTIDNNFGITNRIDVEDGIVKKVYNGDVRLIQKMNIMYVGKEISFLKKDYEHLMGKFVRVRPESLRPFFDKVNSVDTQIGQTESQLRQLAKQTFSYDITEKEKEKALKEADYNARLNNLRVELIKAKEELLSEKERIFRVHRYLV